MAASGSFTWGVLLEAHPTVHLGPYAPLAFFGVGAGAAAGAALLRFARPDPGSRRIPEDGGRPLDDAPVEPPPPRLAAPGRSAPIPVRPLAPTAARAPLSPSADQLWTHWLSDAISALPVELVGPVRETAYSATEPAGAPERIAKRPDWAVSGGRLTPLRPPYDEGDSGRAATEAAIRLGRALAQHAFPPVAGRELDGLPDVTFEDPSGEWDAGLAAAIPPTPVPTPAVVATTRLQPPNLTVVPWTSRGSRTTEPSGSCATCERDLGREDGWEPCPACDDPVCARCRTLAVIQHGQTWCSDCARSRAWNGPDVAT